MAEIIKVKAADPNQVALWERHEDHPDGEVFVSGRHMVEVALTAKVQRLLANGTLVKVEPEAPPTEEMPKTKKAK